MKVLLWVVAIGAALNVIVGIWFFELPIGDLTNSPMYGMPHDQVLGMIVVMYVLMISGCVFASAVLAAAAVRYPVARRNCMAMSVMAGVFAFTYLTGVMSARSDVYLSLLMHLYPSSFNQVRDIIANVVVAIVAGAVAVVPEHELREAEMAQ